ncbi:MAG: hypothetical protein IJ493_02965 [Clostridia bacterium]|nr:hypothetical protein [Clostridia bacterium]
MFKKTTFIRSASFLLALLATAGCTSCGSGESGADTTASGGETTTAVETDVREGVKDSLPEGLSFDGATVRIAARDAENYYIFETVGEENGDVVSDAVYARNRSVEERLNVNLEFIHFGTSAENYMEQVRTVLLSGEDAYDYIGIYQYLGLQHSVEGLFMNLIDAPYIDYSQPWWHQSYMDIISVDSSTRYMLMGDISVSGLRGLSSMFFNKTLYEELYGDPNSLYETVLDGAWTYEQLRTMVTDAYRDVNGNSEVDTEDIFGLGSNAVTQADHYSYTAGLKLSERDKDGYPTLITDQSRNVSVMEAIYKLYYETEGFYLFPQAEQTGAQLNQFIDGRMLFISDRLYLSEMLRDMNDPYGIIPYPKLDEEQEKYLALVHDTATLFCVPVTNTRLDMTCAVLEAMCAETYRTVTPAYYEVALKVKYTHDEISAQIIDMIHENIVTDFVYANNYVFGSNMGTIAREILGKKNNNYMSAYDSRVSQTESGIQSLIDQANEQ